MSHEMERFLFKIHYPTSKNVMHALLTSYQIIIKATDPFGKKGLKEIDGYYNNLNYSDRISFEITVK